MQPYMTSQETRILFDTYVGAVFVGGGYKAVRDWIELLVGAQAHMPTVSVIPQQSQYERATAEQQMGMGIGFAQPQPMYWSKVPQQSIYWPPPPAHALPSLLPHAGMLPPQPPPPARTLPPQLPPPVSAPPPPPSSLPTSVSFLSPPPPSNAFLPLSPPLASTFPPLQPASASPTPPLQPASVPALEQVMYEGLSPGPPPCKSAPPLLPSPSGDGSPFLLPFPTGVPLPPRCNAPPPLINTSSPAHPHPAYLPPSNPHAPTHPHSASRPPYTPHASMQPHPSRSPPFPPQPLAKPAASPPSSNAHRLPPPPSAFVIIMSLLGQQHNFDVQYTFQLSGPTHCPVWSAVCVGMSHLF